MYFIYVYIINLLNNYNSRFINIKITSRVNYSSNYYEYKNYESGLYFGKDRVLHINKNRSCAMYMSDADLNCFNIRSLFVKLEVK